MVRTDPIAPAQRLLRLGHILLPADVGKTSPAAAPRFGNTAWDDTTVRLLCLQE
jgi:hypothetical protein